TPLTRASASPRTDSPRRSASSAALNDGMQAPPPRSARTAEGELQALGADGRLGPERIRVADLDRPHRRTPPQGDARRRPQQAGVEAVPVLVYVAAVHERRDPRGIGVEQAREEHFKRTHRLHRATRGTQEAEGVLQLRSERVVDEAADAAAGTDAA